jgi:hypothetical protein
LLLSEANLEYRDVKKQCAYGGRALFKHRRGREEGFDQRIAQRKECSIRKKEVGIDENCVRPVSSGLIGEGNKEKERMERLGTIRLTRRGLAFGLLPVAMPCFEGNIKQLLHRAVRRVHNSR